MELWLSWQDYQDSFFVLQAINLGKKKFINCFQSSLVALWSRSERSVGSRMGTEFELWLWILVTVWPFLY